MQESVIDLRRFMGLGPEERYHKGYFIPGHPGWLRVMISKRRTDGSIEAQNYRVFLDEEGNVLWQKGGLEKVQNPGDFERDLGDLKHMVEEAGMLMFVQEYNEDEETGRDSPRGSR
jgi:hypothetical protein